MLRMKTTMAWAHGRNIERDGAHAVPTSTVGLGHVRETHRHAP